MLCSGIESFLRTRITRDFILFLILVPFAISAQQYNFINYSIENGLVQSQVNSICQDNGGYIWLGTNGGVSRFDGKNFINYSKENGLLEDQNNVIVKDKKGNVWLGSTGGINKFDGTKFFNYKLKNQFALKTITSMEFDADENLWLSTNGAGLCKFDGENFIYYTENEGLLNNYVNSILCDKKGILWLGTPKGICTYNGTKFDTLSIQVQPRNISQILEDKKGNIWIATYDDGVYKYDASQTLSHFGIKEGVIHKNIRAMLEDHAGNIWFASKAGLIKFDGTSFKGFTQKDGLLFNNLLSVMEDIEGNLWLGSDGKGVFKFTGEAFVNYTMADGLSNEIILSIIGDHQNNLWYCTYGNGVCKYDGKTFTNFSTENGLNNKTVWTGVIDKNNNLWFGTADGASKFDGKKFINYTQKNGLAAKNIYAIHEDTKGNLWFGTFDGLSMFDGTKFTNYSYAEGLTGNFVRSIHEDKKGNLWLATQNGLFKYDGKTFKDYTEKDGLSNNNVVSITEDQHGNLWLGTQNGITYFDGKKFHPLKLENKSSSNYTNFIFFNNDGNLWIGTNNGIFEFYAAEYLKTGKPNFSHYTNLDGIKSLECNLNAVYKDHKGDLWFGTTGGAVKYHKPTLVPQYIEPFIHITDLRLFFQKTKWSGHPDSLDRNSGLPVELKIDYKKNHLTFDFVGISHSNPEKVRYKFMLEGFDEKWSPITDATFATYSNLPFGKYIFKVAASNKEGIWNKKPASFSFEITPPFWKTWWFYCISLILFILIIWLVYLWRWSVIKRKRNTQQLIYKSKLLALEQQTLNASMNRHFIFNALNSIQYYINRQDKLSANKYLTSFAKLIRKNLDSSQSNSVTLSEELERLELYLSLEHMRFQNKFTYKILVEKEIDQTGTIIPAMLLQPYIENSIWHGVLPMENGNGNILVHIKKDQKNLMIIIEDNGIGIDASIKSKENKQQNHISQGMAITEGRINLIRKMTNSTIHVNGPFDVKNEFNFSVGTRVEIIVPIT